MKNLLIIGPEIFLSIVALKILVCETVFQKRNKFWVYTSIVSLFATLVYLILFFVDQSLPGLNALGVLALNVEGAWIQYPPLFDMIAVDSLAVFFKIAIVASMIIILWLSLEYREFNDVPLGTYSALLLLATVGMMLLVGSTDLLMAVISLELLSITSFILVGFIFHRRSSSEAAIKYFLVGSLSTALVLFGISYYYGYFGTTSMTPLLIFPSTGQTPDVILTLILIFLISGFGFKLAMAPFHMWAPDTYEGAPTPITAFLSVAPKAAAVGFLLRLLGNHSSLGITPVLAVLATITMTIGNLGAIHQTNLKRLLAYSSIAQVGYILVAMVAGGSLGTQAAMIYTFVYSFMNLGVFTVLILVSNSTQSDDIEAFAGLSQKHFGVSLILILFLLSMSGIPPLAGFIGKFVIFSSVINQPGLLWLGVVAVLNSVISLYYYFRIAQQMFFKSSDGTTGMKIQLSPAMMSCLFVTLAVTLVAGLMPDQLLGWVRGLVGV